MGLGLEFACDDCACTEGGDGRRRKAAACHCERLAHATDPEEVRGLRDRKDHEADDRGECERGDPLVQLVAQAPGRLWRWRRALRSQQWRGGPEHTRAMGGPLSRDRAKSS